MAKKHMQQATDLREAQAGLVVTPKSPTPRWRQHMTEAWWLQGTE